MSYTLHRCTPADAPLTASWLVRQYGFEPEEVADWLENLHFNWPTSVKALDGNGHPIGLLNMSDYRVEEETEQILTDCPDLIQRLNQMRYIAVFSFIVAEEYRGTRLNYEMLTDIWGDLQAYDFVYVPVMHHLKTHQYWKRWGAVEFYRDAHVTHYLIPLSGQAKTLCLEPRQREPQRG